MRLDRAGLAVFMVLALLLSVVPVSSGSPVQGRDVAVINVLVNPSEPILGETCEIEITVKNCGTAVLTDIPVKLLVNGSQVDSTTVERLAQDEQATLTFEWTPENYGVYSITGVAGPIEGEAGNQINNFASTIVSISLITTAHVQDQAVTTSKLADAAVIASKIADFAIETRHLQEDRIRTAGDTMTGDLTFSGTAAIRMAETSGWKIYLYGEEAGIRVEHGSPAKVYVVADSSLTFEIPKDTPRISFDYSIANAGIYYTGGLYYGLTATQRGIPTEDIMDSAVTSAKIQDATITGTDIADDTITGANIAADAVGSSEIATNAVGSDEIATGAVGTSEIAIGAVTTNRIADAAITSIQILDDTITAADIATGAVTTDEILDGTITADDIGPNAVGSDEIAAGAVNTSEIATGAVTTNRLADAAVTSVKIYNRTIQGEDIAEGAITSYEIADGTITSADIQDATITDADIHDVSWNKLTNVPAGFADGVDDTGLLYIYDVVAGGTLSQLLIYRHSGYYSSDDWIRCDWVIFSIPDLDVSSTLSFRILRAYWEWYGDVRAYINSPTDMHAYDGTLIYQGTYSIGSIVEVTIPPHTTLVGLWGESWWLEFTRPVLTWGGYQPITRLRAEEGLYGRESGGVGYIGIADGGVTTSKLADAAVTSAKIMDGEVKTVDIGDAAVTIPKLKVGSFLLSLRGGTGQGYTLSTFFSTFFGGRDTIYRLSDFGTWAWIISEKPGWHIHNYTGEWRYLRIQGITASGPGFFIAYSPENGQINAVTKGDVSMEHAISPGNILYDIQNHPQREEILSNPEMFIFDLERGMIREL